MGTKRIITDRSITGRVVRRTPDELRAYRRGQSPDAQALRDLKRQHRRAQRDVKSRAQRKRDQRAAQLPSPRICPVCTKPKLASRQWVVFPKRTTVSWCVDGTTPYTTITTAVCRSCAILLGFVVNRSETHRAKMSKTPKITPA